MTPRHLALLLGLVLPSQDDPRAERVELWRAHYARVERELLTHEPAGLTPDHRTARSALIAALARYRERGDFTRQEVDPLALVPRFVDSGGRRCAVAELLHATERDELVARVHERANGAWVADLARDGEFLAWLDAHGLTLAEAARIQTPAEYGGADTVPPGEDPPPAAPRKRDPTLPVPEYGGQPASSPGLAQPARGETERALDAWWLWWELNKLAYLGVRGLEQRLASEGGRSAADLSLMTEPLRATREPLFLAALADADALVRAAGALSLGRTAGERAVRPLARLLSDPSQRVREHALFGLGATGSSAGAAVLLALLEHDGRQGGAQEAVSPRAVPLAILALGVGRRAGMDAGVARAVALFAPRASEPVRSAALWAACLFQRLAPDPATEALVLDLLRDDAYPRSVRAAAIEALGPSPDPIVLARLQSLLVGRDLELRRSAALALAGNPQASATGALMTAYELESEPLARGFALLSIGQRGGLPARDLLLEELERGPLAVEPWAALGLGLHARGSNDASIRAALLAGAAGARSEESRPAFLVALGLAREPLAQPLARASLETSPSARERGYAATCLALLGGSSNRDFLRGRMALERSGFARAAIAQALSTLGDERDAPGLFEALARLADPGLRAVTAASLGLLGAPSALKGLEELAGDARGSPLLRATAVDGLGVLLERAEPLVLPEVSRGANYAVYEDWVFDLFQLTL